MKRSAFFLSLILTVSLRAEDHVSVSTAQLDAQLRFFTCATVIEWGGRRIGLPGAIVPSGLTVICSSCPGVLNA